MSKRVVLIGHCGADSSYLRMLVVRAAGPGAQVLSINDEAELQRAIGQGGQGVDLVLVNRILDYGFAEETGADLIKRLKGQRPELNLMLVSNYPDAQAEAVAAGALQGFGKREIGSPRTVELVKVALKLHATHPAGQG